MLIRGSSTGLREVDRRSALADDRLALAEELNWLISMLAEEAEGVLKNAAH